MPLSRALPACLRLILLLLGGVHLLALPAWAGSALEVAAAGAAPLVLTPHVEVLVDADGAWSLADVRAPPLADRFAPVGATSSALNFSYTDAAIWLRLTVRNDGRDAVQRLLQIGKARLSDVRFFHPEAAGGWRAVATGDALPFASRAYPNRFFVFPVTLPAGTEQTWYLRIRSSNAMFIPVQLWAPEDFHVHERNDYAGQAAYFGMAAGMVLFNLLLFVALRDAIYLFYVAFVGAMAFAIAAQNGLVKEFSSVDSPLFSQLTAPLGFTLAIVTCLLFMRRMLRTRQCFPRMDRWLAALAWLNLAASLAYLKPVPAVGIATQALALSSMVAMMAVGVYCAWRRQRGAYFFVAAYLVLFVAGMITSLAGLGLLPANAVSMNALQFGSALEMLLLALALADRFNVLRREKEAAQQQLLENLQRSERVLEESVVRRTAELQASLDDLQAARDQLMVSEQRAVEGQRVARAALAGQRQFIAMVSHEFRSPLAVIDAAVRLLAVKLGDGDGSAPILARIRRGVARLSGFLDNCLTEDRLDGEGMSLHVEEIDLAALAAAVVDGARQGSERHSVVAEVEPGLTPLRADPQLLRIMLLNLLGNAVKYSPQGGEVRLRIGRADGACRFEVSDRGMGIPADELALVFGKYMRGRGAQSTPGAGLGLALVARIAELHGGAVGIDSREGEGTRVTVTLPIQ